MKKSGKIAAIALSSALALTVGAFALTGCDAGTEYTFEAENAVVTGQGVGTDGQTMVDAAVETNVVWAKDGNGAEVTGIGCFNTKGQKITWTVVAEEACTATLILHAASAQMYMNMPEDGNWENATAGIAAVDFSKSQAYSMKVNGTEVSLKGKLPETVFEGGFAGMGAPGVWWHMGTASCKVDLKAGDNTVVFEIVGDGANGINVDKITVKSSSPLSEKAE